MDYSMKKILAIALCTVAFGASASEVETSKESFSTWRFSYDQITLDSVKSTSQGIGDSIGGIGIAMDFKRGSIVGGFGMFAGGVDDAQGFTQTVQDQNGDVFDASSSTSAVSFFGEAGISYVAKEKAYLELVGGYQTMSISRSIDKCEDCASDSIDISGGLYVKPRLRVAFGDKFLASLSYISYLSGDVKSGLLIGFEGRF
jgi:hypothetical protein